MGQVWLTLSHRFLLSCSFFKGLCGRGSEPWKGLTIASGDEAGSHGNPHSLRQGVYTGTSTLENNLETDEQKTGVLTLLLIRSTLVVCSGEMPSPGAQDTSGRRCDRRYCCLPNARPTPRSVTNNHSIMRIDLERAPWRQLL